MRSIRFPVAAALAAVAALAAGATIAATAATPAPSAQPTAARPTAAPLNLYQLVSKPLCWPEAVSLNQELSDGATTLKPGTSLRVYAVQADGVVVDLAPAGSPKGPELTLLPADATDVIEKANALAAELPAEGRDLTLEALAMRGDLLPPTVKLTAPVTFDLPAGPKTLAAGAELVPIRLENFGNAGLTLSAVEPSAVADGTIKERFNYEINTTDLIPRVRERVKQEAAKRPSRLLAELDGKLVTATDGKPVDAAAAGAAGPKYYVVYYSAGWCGWCKQYTPLLKKFYDEQKPKHPEFEVVYLPADHSAEEMAKHLADEKMTWEAVPFEKRGQVPLLLGMTDGGTPHVIVLRRDGLVIHDGRPAGMNGAKAALSALSAQFARDEAAQRQGGGR